MRLGYHRNCGGVVFQTKKRGLSCSSCRTHVPEADVMAERPVKVRQKQCGKKAKRKRYDIKDWSEV